MIVVTVLDTGDSCEPTDDPEVALCAAKQMGRDARTLGIEAPQIKFVNDDTGEVIRVCSLRSLTR